MSVPTAMKTETFFTIEMPYRERMEIRRTVFSGGGGPRLSVVAGIHGDELEGLYVCHRLAAWLDELQRTSPGGLLGSIELYPAVNTLGLDTLTRGLPVFDTDLNRAFPGSAGGPLPERLAAALREDAAGLLAAHGDGECRLVESLVDEAVGDVPLERVLDRTSRDVPAAAATQVL